VEGSLRKLGFPVREARVGRLVDLELETTSPDEARAKVDEMCRRLLANPLIESYEIALDD
jgi:phosphoribosylformylglycinamidine synthase